MPGAVSHACELHVAVQGAHCISLQVRVARIPEETLRASVEGSLEVAEGSADAAEAKAEEEEKEEESGREGHKVPP